MYHFRVADNGVVGVMSKTNIVSSLKLFLEHPPSPINIFPTRSAKRAKINHKRFNLIIFILHRIDFVAV